MKKIFNIFTLLLSVFAFSACVSEVDDVFNDSAASRADKAIADAKTILQSAPNGWRMEYYGDTSYGGYNVFMKFEGDSVTVASEQVGSTQPAGFDENGNVRTCKSHFKVEQSMGVVLSLDEYNDIFHWFCDPRNSEYGSDGDGFYGDFEFRIKSISADKIELTGKKHGNRIMMYPMAEDTSWGDYIKQVQATEEFMSSRTYTLQIGDDAEGALYAQSTYRRLTFWTTNDEGQDITVNAPYTVTPEGYVLYDTVTVAKQTLSGFKKGDTQDYFEATGLDNVKLYTEVPTLYDTFRRGLWYMTYDDMGTFGQQQWETLFDGLGKADNGKKRARLYYAAIGYVSSQYQSALEIATSTDSQVLVGFSFSAVPIPNDPNGAYYGDRVVIRNRPGTWNKIGQTYYSKYGLKAAMDVFGSGNEGHTFQISADNVRHPSYIILTDLNDPTNVIKLWPTTKMYPFGDRDKEDK